MDYKTWVKLFGKSADDPAVRQALAKAGITSRIKMARDELSAREDIDGEGTTIIFTDDTILRPDDAGAVVGRPIVSSVLMILDARNKKDLYKGPLPHKLKQNESRDGLRKRFGTPSQINDTFRADAWEIDGLTVGVGYSKDLMSLTEVSLSLPNSQ
jgi:hypothetical protein